MSVDIVRDAAIGVLLRVFEQGAFLSVVLDKALRRQGLTERGRRFMTNLVYGTVRHKLLCDHILGRLARQPLTELPPAILAILRMGTFQSLFCSQVTFPSMVHTSVDLAKRYGHAGTARLVNAVLKRVPQSMAEVPEVPGEVIERLSIRHSIPRWLVDEWIREHGPETAAILCAASNCEAPVTLRTNTLKTSVTALQQELIQTGYAAEKQTAVPEELTLSAGKSPLRSKLFLAGHFLMQDPASMLPPHLLDPHEGESILDLCAAPGMKTTHIAQLTNDHATIIALDRQLGKMSLLGENLRRLGITGIRVLCGDGLRPPFCSGFDRVLVDAPCSGTGTLRRHPDLKWRLRPDDAVRMAEGQAALLRSAIELCKNGGLVVYSVCSISRCETDHVVDTILKDGKAGPEDGPEWMNHWKIGRGRYRTLPELAGLDGFFLMRLRKRS